MNVKAWTLPATASAPGKWIKPSLDQDRTSGAKALLGQTLQNSYRFHARSSLSELLNYALCVVLFHLVVGAVLMLAVSYPVQAAIQDLLQAAYFIPLPALLARRLHDQDRSAILLALAIPGVGLWLVRKALVVTQAVTARTMLDSYVWPIDLVAGLASLALIIALILPGTAGPNRFGPDPRQS